jgi:ribonuclease HII
VAERVEGDLTVRAEHGADAAHDLVAAASVVAKVERDRRIEHVAAEYGEVGSGYPSDPTTRAFLREYVREHGTLPACARSSWATADDALAAAEQSALDEF